MGTATLNNSQDLVTFQIAINGVSINSAYQVVSMRVTEGINRISMATITILDGDPNTQSFSISDSSDFIPGNKITISAGYDAKESLIFSGIILKQQIQISSNIGSAIIVSCTDDAIKMTVGRNNGIYTNTTDSEAITKIVSKHGLSTNIAVTSYQHKELVQYNCSDWDFILSRADVNGFFITTHKGIVSMQKPDTSATPVLSLIYGDNIHALQIEANASNQYTNVQSESWDVATQKNSISNSAASTIATPGNLNPASLASVIGIPSFNLQTNAAIGSDESQAWANACLQKSRLAMIKGTVRFQGSAVISSGCMITMSGLSARFNGNIFVSGVEHEISDGNWQTTAKLGMNGDWIAEYHEHINSPEASALLPAISGLQTGKVSQIDEDPNNQYRVLVNIPMLNNEKVWARLGSLYASNNAGTFFYPEVGDEVILGFMNNDPRYPIILGSLYSSSMQPPSSPQKNNYIKSIVGKSGVNLTIDDEKKSISLCTSANNKVVINEGEKSISLTDESGNKIMMSPKGIVIESSSDLSLKADGNITISSDSSTQITAFDDLSLSGLTITGSAEAEMIMEGVTSAELSSSGEVTVKGAMVMIN
jgi:Rhs element Vgr protein